MGQYITKTLAFAYGLANGQRKKLYKERKKTSPIMERITHPIGIDI